MTPSVVRGIEACWSLGVGGEGTFAVTVEGPSAGKAIEECRVRLNEVISTAIETTPTEDRKRVAPPAQEPSSDTE